MAKQERTWSALSTFQLGQCCGNYLAVDLFVMNCRQCGGTNKIGLVKILKPIYKEWWHGSRACSLSYFWDLAHEFELPVLCRNCYRCYATLPQKCSELCDPLNWNELVQEYDLQCTDCGARVRAKQKFTKVSVSLYPCYIAN